MGLFSTKKAKSREPLSWEEVKERTRQEREVVRQEELETLEIIGRSTDALAVKALEVADSFSANEADQRAQFMKNVFRHMAAQTLQVCRGLDNEHAESLSDEVISDYGTGYTSYTNGDLTKSIISSSLPVYEQNQLEFPKQEVIVIK